MSRLFHWLHDPRNQLLLLTLVAAQPGCSSGGKDSAPGGDTGSCTDTDRDGVCEPLDICPGGDDSLDSDGDGTPDPCQIDFLDSFQTGYNYLDTTSTHLSGQLVFDTDGAMSTWVLFEPGLQITKGSAEPTLTWTRDLEGWQEVQDRFGDAKQDFFSLYVVGLDDGFIQLMTFKESYINLNGLQGAVVTQLSFLAVDWYTDPLAGEAIDLYWEFRGYYP